MIKHGEIVFANLTVMHKDERINLKEVVYKYTDGFYRNMRILKKLRINQKVKVLKVDIIHRLGFENKSKLYTAATKNDESRNTTTGAYE